MGEGLRRIGPEWPILLMALAIAWAALPMMVHEAKGLGVANLVPASVYWGSNPALPMTVKPGDEGVTLSVVVANAGDDFARDVEGILWLEPPFRHRYRSSNEWMIADNATQSAGDIPPGGAFTFRYILSVDPGAEEGVYRLRFELRYRSARELRAVSKAVHIDVPLWAGDVRVHRILTMPAKIFPGDSQVTLKVFVINSGQGGIRDLELRLGIDRPFRMASSSSDRAFLGTLQPQQIVEANFLIDIDEGAGPGNYSLPVYALSPSRPSSPIGRIQLTVAEKARFEVLEISPSKVRAGDSGVRVAIRVRNAAGVKAESVRARLLAGNFFSGTLTDLMGTMNPGDVRTAFFTLDVDGGAVPQTYSMDLKFDWIQDGRYSLSDTIGIEMEVLPSLYPIVVALVLLGIAAFAALMVWRRRRKRPSK
ncbi:MAG: hypothetical protein QXU06_02405 [Candidatus Bathyarchaeia archaeon]